MATKYIVDNLTGQTITGDITINGNLTVTGTTSGLLTYKALLTQSLPTTGYGLSDFNGGLIIGETYTIIEYRRPDDFSNIADVQSGGGSIISFETVWSPVVGFYGSFNGLTGTTSDSGSGASFDGYWCGTTTPIITHIEVETSGGDYLVGDTITILGTELSGSTPANDMIITVTEVNSNQTGCVFIATGDTPTNWNYFSTLESSGNLAVTVLENNLGFDIEWFDGFDVGTYFGVNSTTPLYNTFNRNTTFVLGGPNLLVTYGTIEIVTNPTTYVSKDDSIIVAVFDVTVPELVPGLLYYFPVEIQIKQDTDTTPIVISGTVVSPFPFPNAGVDLMCGDMYIQSIYGSGGVVNNMSELIIQLNSGPNTSYLGTYSDDGVGGVLLEMPTNLVNQFCANSTLMFNVFPD